MVISLIIGLAVLGVAFYLISLIPMASPFPEIIRVVAIIIAVVMVLQALGFSGLPTLR